MWAAGQCGNFIAVSLRLEQVVELLPRLLVFICAGFNLATIGSSASCGFEVLTEVGDLFFYGGFSSVFEAAGGVCRVKVLTHATAVQFVKTLVAGGLAAEGKRFFGQTGTTVKTA
jgi:hypothetical protein